MAKRPAANNVLDLSNPDHRTKKELGIIGPARYKPVKTDGPHKDKITGIPPLNTITLGRVSNAIADTLLATANPQRRRSQVHNDSATANVYLKYGTGASATSYNVKLAPGAQWEMPDPPYIGQINIFADAASGATNIADLS